jgi:hypothetical protein
VAPEFATRTLMKPASFSIWAATAARESLDVMSHWMGMMDLFACDGGYEYWRVVRRIGLRTAAEATSCSLSIRRPRM